MSNTSMPANFLNRHRLAFHHRLGGQRADVAEAEHRGAVGDHANQIAARGERCGARRIVDDRQAREATPGE